jgi:hypothetical protein
LANIPKVIKKA